MEFGGTSVGTPERMRSIIPLIADNERKIVVLSALSGTTNSLVEISGFLHDGKTESGLQKIEALRSKYDQVVTDLYTTDEGHKAGFDLINAHFSFLENNINIPFSRVLEKSILAEGELISTSLFHILLREMGIRSVLLPALNFMRIDKDGEPDSFYIAENIKRELEKYPDENIFITQGFICRNAFGEIDNLKRGGSDYTASLLGAALNASEIQIWTDINGFHNNDPRIVKN